MTVKIEETKSRYQAKNWKFDGITAYERLMDKIKTVVKKGRIRLLEFFQDHDPLRKGTVPYMKFKGVLRGQNIELTEKEYDTLLDKFRCPNDSTHIEYLEFNEGQTKTRTVSDCRDIKAMPPKMLATDGSEKVPIVVYKLYAQKRLEKMNEDDSPFYLAVNNNLKAESLQKSGSRSVLLA